MTLDGYQSFRIYVYTPSLIYSGGCCVLGLAISCLRIPDLGYRVKCLQQLVRMPIRRLLYFTLLVRTGAGWKKCRGGQAVTEKK